MTTQITDSAARAVHALQTMEGNAFRVSQVTTRILDEHTGLPGLLAVRPEATDAKACVVLQPHSLDDAFRWSAALGMALSIEDEPDGAVPGRRYRRSTAKGVVDGVTVYVMTSESFSASEWAELRAGSAVAA
ncbi:hypothetical protein [Streptomyces caniscabiei]|uniref:hypothetical protein n=1 Tax=Streptomyces caniscabiei TaxID=2746961 RepID=UPI000765CF85|nr:hypothetical protein [Streptomyces caniscabiei]